MTELPEPLTPADCDLRGNDWMPLHGHKLYNSWFDAHATDAEWRAAHQLWWFSWNEVPAASVPDDDVQLCKQVGLGRDLKAWSKIRKMALHGFIKCSDGRLYHQFLAPEAVVAYDKRLKADTKRAADRERLKAWREAQKAARVAGTTNGSGNEGSNSHETRVETPLETDHETRFVGGGQDKTRQDIKEESSDLRSGASPPLDARTELWREGVPIVQRLTGKPESHSRALVGRLLRDMRDDCAGLSAVLAEAQSSRPIDPVSWLAAAVQARASPGKRPDRRAASIAKGLAALGISDDDMPTLPRMLLQ